MLKILSVFAEDGGYKKLTRSAATRITLDEPAEPRGDCSGAYVPQTSGARKKVQYAPFRTECPPWITHSLMGNGSYVIDTSTRIAGRYRVDARLGGGGMADVYDAHDEVLDRPVAVKLLRGIDDADAARRFAEEIRLTARVNHPNIVALYDAGEHDGSPFLVLERVNGGTLAGEMAAGPMDPRRVAEIGEQLASALSHSHAAGIVHRDVKPTNVLMAADGSVRLADFGIAVTATATRLTVTGTVAGSAGYVSPEQVLGSGAGAASDIYALGLVLLECLVGAPPWSGTTVEVALARITADPPMPADLPQEWRVLLTAMTAREPDERPAVDLVGHALSRLAVGAEYETAFFAAAPTPDRRVPAVAGLSVVVLLLSALLVMSSNVTPGVAVAADEPVISISASDHLLSKAVVTPTELPVADSAADRAAQRRAAAQAARRDKARREARLETAQAAQAPAAAASTAADASSAPRSTATDSSTDDNTSQPRTATRLDVPTVPVSSTTTTVDTPTTTTTPTRTVTTTSTKKLKGLRKAAAQRAAAADLKAGRRTVLDRRYRH